VLNGLQVLLTPGHTPGHISFFDPAERILFSGDSIVIDGGTPAPSRGGNTWDIACARASFEQQLALAPVWICGGHGIWPSKRPANT
jgi:glyoxylase-like metal-dependent hydrolase (beta-lactamase superfamily II)